jgi:hypothetical protein
MTPEAFTSALLTRCEVDDHQPAFSQGREVTITLG